MSRKGASFNPPAWLDAEMYPYIPHRFSAKDGEISYVDEGKGPPILFVHGTPTWSFLWRDAIDAFKPEYRVIAPDHLGFGLSDKPERAPLSPRDHADRLEALVRHLGLRDVTLVVHDFGGPIGLDWALRDLSNVKRLVLMNTFLWPLGEERMTRIAGRVMGSRFGRFLYRQLNVSPRFLMPSMYRDKNKLTEEIHRHYVAPFSSPEDREAPWVLARELLGSKEHYEQLWRERSRLADVPTLILWGMNDPSFTPAHLEKWEEALPSANVVRLEDTGHFVMEEAPVEAVDAMSEFFGTTGRPSDV